MALLTDDQKMLQETAASFLAEEGSIAKELRHWRDSGCTDGYGTDLWKQFGELGLTGIEPVTEVTRNPPCSIISTAVLAV